MQRLFTAARWNEELVRDDVSGYVTAALSCPDGVLLSDDTGFEKKGSHLAGGAAAVHRNRGQDHELTGGVFLAYAGPKGRALIDRELYLPRSWAGDEARVAATGVPAGTAFRTKPQFLQLMIEQAAAAGIPFRWVTADEAYGTTDRFASTWRSSASPMCWLSPATTWLTRPRVLAGSARPGSARSQPLARPTCWPWSDTKAPSTGTTPPNCYRQPCGRGRTGSVRCWWKSASRTSGCWPDGRRAPGLTRRVWPPSCELFAISSGQSIVPARRFAMSRRSAGTSWTSPSGRCGSINTDQHLLHGGFDGHPKARAPVLSKTKTA
ncbi:transposase [Trebonia kvetii]|uniref:Transposase n=1 Tax=Trebonia kvetii TaxID=2480626 RepID=A0A6P2C0V1_9ACTN|nr:transposase [Trebonia kvetii]